jgi:hypothetical protein
MGKKRVILDKSCIKFILTKLGLQKLRYKSKKELIRYLSSELKIIASQFELTRVQLVKLAETTVPNYERLDRALIISGLLRKLKKEPNDEN